MTSISWIDGWRYLLMAPKFPTLGQAAEAMYRLNIYARGAKRSTLSYQIYSLKDDFIKYLYQHGYCKELTLHVQKRMCFSCDGTGEHWSGGDCWKCDGTGVYSRTNLYAFRFEIQGKRYSWHQLEKLINYEVALTDMRQFPYQAPGESTVTMTLEQAWRGCCLIWWALLWRGVRSEFILFGGSRVRILYKIKMFFEKIIKKDEAPF